MRILREDSPSTNQKWALLDFSTYRKMQESGLTESFPGGSDHKESACNVGDLGSFPGLGSSPGEGNGYPLQYSGLENPMERRLTEIIPLLSQLSGASILCFLILSPQDTPSGVGYSS